MFFIVLKLGVKSVYIFSILWIQLAYLGLIAGTILNTPHIFFNTTS